MVDNLLELCLSDVASQAAGYLLTVALSLIKLQLVGDQEESSLKYCPSEDSAYFLVWCITYYLVPNT